MMSDCEDGDVWESWISPVKRKRKKNSQKDKKCVKLKNASGKTDESSKKKKKKKKKEEKEKNGFKEAMVERKETKKEKKVKKQKSSVGFDDSFLFTQRFTCAEPEPESPHRPSTENVTEDSQKKTKRKKKVAFALSPGPIAIKRPKDTTPPQRGGDGGGCSLVTGPSRPLDHDSQCTSDDVNSQDLFITQKTFRTSPVESSSGEASGSTSRHESYSHQRPRATPVLEHPLLREEEEEEEEEEGLFLTKQISKKEPVQTEVNTNLTREKKAFRPRQGKKLRGVNPFLDDPVALKSKTKTHSCSSGQPSPSGPLNPPEPSLPPHKSNTSTQTENFFTAELSSFLNFCLKGPGAVCFEALEPLDLSLPQRARNQPGGGLSGVHMRHDEEKTPSPPDRTSSTGQEDAGRAPSRSSDPKKEASGRQRRSVGAQRKDKTSPSPESESDPKSTDTTTSSEDNETACGTGKLDMTQVRAVQMRLNESFFFKAKGDGRSHRPESPLMKLAQGREMKSRKGH